MRFPLPNNLRDFDIWKDDLLQMVNLSHQTTMVLSLISLDPDNQVLVINLFIRVMVDLNMIPPQPAPGASD